MHSYIYDDDGTIKEIEVLKPYYMRFTVVVASSYKKRYNRNLYTRRYLLFDEVYDTVGSAVIVSRSSFIC